MNKQSSPWSHHFTTYYINDASVKDGKPIVNRIAEVEVVIYPMDDDAMKDGIADDVFVTDTRTSELVYPSKQLEALIIAQIKEERPQEWSEIRALGAANAKAYSLDRKVDELIEDRLEHRELHKDWRDNS
jgi:hypothetical protein